jgi:glycosyltransferase involved in cell wall biosynthesis
MGAGGDRWLIEVAPRLVNNGVQPTVIASNFVARSYRSNITPWFVRQLIDKGIAYSEIPTSSIFNRLNLPLLLPKALSMLSREMKTHDLTYFMNAYAFQDISVWLAKIMSGGAKVMSSQHATMYQEGLIHNLYVSLVTRPFLRTFDSHHVLNREDYARYREWRIDNVHMQPNGVDTKRFIPLPKKDESAFTALFVGRLDYQKGIDTTIDAMRELETSNPAIASKINLKICGTGPMSEMVEKFASKRDNVSYLGYVSDEDLLEYYKSVSICLMPSRRETFGLVAMEAMASGTPVLVTDIPGPRTFVEESFGRMVPPENAKALSEALVWYYRLFSEDPDELREMGNRARDICIKEYDWDIVAQKLAKSMRQTVYS